MIIMQDSRNYNNINVILLHAYNDLANVITQKGILSYMQNVFRTKKRSKSSHNVNDFEYVDIYTCICTKDSKDSIIYYVKKTKGHTHVTRKSRPSRQCRTDLFRIVDVINAE